MISSDLTVDWAITAAASVTSDLELDWPVLPFQAAVTSDLIVGWVFGTQDTFELVLVNAPTGLAGLILLTLTSEDGTITLATTSSIVELPAGTGRYVATMSFPEPGRYYAIWSYGGFSVSVPVTVRVAGNIEAEGGLRIPVGA